MGFEGGLRVVIFDFRGAATEDFDASCRCFLVGRGSICKESSESRVRSKAEVDGSIRLGDSFKLNPVSLACFFPSLPNSMGAVTTREGFDTTNGGD